MEVGARRGAHFQQRTSITMIMSSSRQQCGYGLLDHILTRNGYDSQQYDGFPFQNQSLNK
jgi:hypothetical protein